jgi:hypothetical protein
MIMVPTPRSCRSTHLLAGFIFVTAALATAPAEDLPRLKYNHPGLVVDLGVGLWAWPLPMDYDRDGDLDLVVACPDVPYNGTYFFENPGVDGGGSRGLPVFKPAVRIGPGPRNLQVSYIEGEPRVLAPRREFANFRETTFDAPRPIHSQENIHGSRVRANQWKYADYDGDGAIDLIVGVGDWTDYGWDNAYNDRGEWTNGPLHGYVYLLRNTGTSDAPQYAEPVKITAAGVPVDVFGMPSPNLADFDSDGDLDLVCGEFLDGFTYFENVGSRTEPKYAAGRRLVYEGQPLAMDLQMITPTAVDWDADGHVDLVVGDEDGRVALVRHTGRVDDGLPEFEPPVYFQQEADGVKFGALVTPFACDWDDDGDEDLICGNTAGYVGLIENLGGSPPKWAAPVRLQAAGETIRIQAGPSGSIQGPAEAKWGYTTLSVADWDHDGRQDILVNSIWGRVVWYRNVGTRQEPKLAVAEPVRVAWPSAPPKLGWTWWDPQPGELVTQWRTTPLAIDLNQDTLCDLVMLDPEGYLAFYERSKTDSGLRLLPPKRIFRNQDGQPLRLNDQQAGRSGRRKFCLADWDGAGTRQQMQSGAGSRLDLLVNGTNVDFWRNIGTPEMPWRFQNDGPVSDHRLAGHTTSPTVADFDRDGVLELVIGAEDGFLYHLPR